MVRVDLAPDVYEAVQARAIPLEDDVNSVLRRAFGINGSTAVARAAPGSLLHTSEYEPAIVRALGDAGAFGPDDALHRNDVTERVGEFLSDRLTDSDRTLNASGRVRWENRTGWMLTRLKNDGQLECDGRGGWWLTEGGRAAFDAG